MKILSLNCHSDAMNHHSDAFQRWIWSWTALHNASNALSIKKLVHLEIILIDVNYMYVSCKGCLKPIQFAFSFLCGHSQEFCQKKIFRTRVNAIIRYVKKGIKRHDHTSN